MRKIDVLLQSQLEIIRLLGIIEKQVSQSAGARMEFCESSKICKELEISRRTLEKYREKGILPSSKLGARVYFRIADINHYLNANLVFKNSAP